VSVRNLGRLRRALARLRRSSGEVDYGAMRPPWSTSQRVREFSKTPNDEAFITGNGIAARCRSVINYNDLTVNDAGREGWWFCKSDYLDYFFAEHAPTTPYVLFSHNSDRAVDGRYRSRLNEDRLVAWFAPNPVIRHPKLHAVPMGLSNPVWEHGDQAAVKRVQASLPPKKMLFDVSFNPETNPKERHRCLAKTGLEVAERLPYEQYLRRLASAYFCISPNGNGIDCHRTWEALYLRTIPVVTRSIVTEEHSDMPMIVLDDWGDFSQVDFSPSLYERVWGHWDPVEIRLDRYFERIERTIGALTHYRH
jgi:hypothetical protein